MTDVWRTKIGARYAAACGLDEAHAAVEGALRTAVALHISMTTILIDMLTADIRRLP